MIGDGFSYKPNAGKIVAFRSAKVRYFRGAKGDSECDKLDREQYILAAAGIGTILARRAIEWILATGPTHSLARRASCVKLDRAEYNSN